MEREKRESRRLTKEREKRQRQLAEKRAAVIFALAACIFMLGFGSGWMVRSAKVRGPVDLSAIAAPDWIDQQFISVNRYSRPGTKLAQVNGIVIHYIGNPGTTAQQNRNYFDSLKNQSGSNVVSVSSNFIVGLDGEIIQCIPVDEKAYASNNRNSDTISIECCHPEADGVFTDETYESLVRLCAWLCTELDLDEKDVIRHYDITGKSCPKYFVEDENAWKTFRRDVKKAIRKMS